MHRSTIAIEIFNCIVDSKDGTLDVMGYALPDNGYFVGGEGAPLVFESAEEANRPEAMRKISAFVDRTRARFIGWWTDSETGKVYVDGTTWFAVRSEAMRTSRERQEIAFWDIAGQSEIRTS